MSTWWRRLLAAFQPAELVEARRRIAELEQQKAGLLALLEDARAKQHAAEAANLLHGQMARDLDARIEQARKALTDMDLSDPVARLRARMALTEIEPQPAERGGDGG